MQEISLRDGSSITRPRYADYEPVPFLDGHIPAVVIDGEPHVLPRPVATVLGIAWAPQHAKLSAARWACVTTIVTQLPGDTQARQQIAISLETFTTWIAGIQEGRVAKEAEETIIFYKKEAGRALRRHFFGEPAKKLDELEVAERYVATLKRNRALEAVNAEQAKELEGARPRAAYVDTFVDPGASNTLFRTFCGQIGAPERKLREHLMAKKVIYKKWAGRHYSKTRKAWEDVYEYQAHAPYKAWFHAVDQPDAPRLHNNQMRTTLYVTPVGKVGITKWLERNPIEGAA